MPGVWNLSQDVSQRSTLSLRFAELREALDNPSGAVEWLQAALPEYEPPSVAASCPFALL